jgi:hypothetical protein
VEDEHRPAEVERRLVGEVDPNLDMAAADDRAAADLPRALIVAGWMLRILQVGSPPSNIWPPRFIAIEIVRSCGGGSAPSAVLKVLSTLTATGATPSRGSARGEMPPSKLTMMFPLCSSSAWAAPAAQSARRSASANALFFGPRRT